MQTAHPEESFGIHKTHFVVPETTRRLSTTDESNTKGSEATERKTTAKARAYHRILIANPKY